MSKIVVLPLWVALLISCAHGKTEQFPTTATSPHAPEVFIFRDNSLVGWGFTLKVALDDAVIAHLRAGEYVKFSLAPGLHALGLTKATETIALEPDQKYYFLISPDYTQFGFRISRIGTEKAEYWLARTKLIE
jgi:hypothetical protein